MFPIREEDALHCCASRAFARALSSRQYVNVGEALEEARAIWWQQVPVAGWLEAFAAHPRLGDRAGLGSRTDAFAAASRGEQAAAAAGSASTLQELRQCNALYEERFGHIFIACAAGKPAQVLLDLLKQRLQNEPHAELLLAAHEQMKITTLRLQQLLAGAPGGGQPGAPQSRPDHGRSPVTTHVLDIAAGRAAQGVPVQLELRVPGPRDGWEPLGRGTTDENGRVGGLLPSDHLLAAGTYRLTFDTSAYASAATSSSSSSSSSSRTFFPRPAVEFVVAPGQEQQHFHVPLTYAPFGYSTYRGT